MRLNRRIVVILDTWPSKEHPYLVYLYDSLKKSFPYLQLFCFRDVKDKRFAEELIGAEAVKHILSNCIYRFRFCRNPFAFIIPLFRILKYGSQSLSIFKSCRNDGYSFHQSLGQLFYANALLGNNYDLVYFNALQSARHFSLRSIFPRSIILASSRGQDFDLTPTAYDKVLAEVNHLHVLGRYLQEKAMSRGYPPQEITIIPPAILPLKGAELNERSDDSMNIRIVSAARIFWGKGFVYSLRAFALLIDRLPKDIKCEYIIFGYGPDLEYLKLEVSRLGLQDSVRFEGWRDQHEVDRYLMASDIYMLLSITEGFNNSVMQAQSLGLPCVVSDAGGLPENVVDGETGFVVPRYDYYEAADRLHSLVVDVNLRKRLGTNARERMAQKFELAKQVEQYELMFNKFLDV